MVLRKILLISLVLFGLLFFQMASKCLADVSTQFERAKSYEKNQEPDNRCLLLGVLAERNTLIS